MTLPLKSDGGGSATVLTRLHVIVSMIQLIIISRSYLLLLANTLSVKFSDWSKSEFGVSFSTLCIAREMTVHEIPSEVISLLGAMDKGVQFSEK
jgi:hypothetical protein